MLALCTSDEIDILIIGKVFIILCKSEIMSKLKLFSDRTLQENIPFSKWSEDLNRHFTEDYSVLKYTPYHPSVWNIKLKQ